MGQREGHSIVQPQINTKRNLYIIYHSPYPIKSFLPPSLFPFLRPSVLPYMPPVSLSWSLSTEKPVAPCLYFPEILALRSYFPSLPASSFSVVMVFMREGGGGGGEEGRVGRSKTERMDWCACYLFSFFVISTRASSRKCTKKP